MKFRESCIKKRKINTTITSLSTDVATHAQFICMFVHTCTYTWAAWAEALITQWLCLCFPWCFEPAHWVVLPPLLKKPISGQNDLSRNHWVIQSPVVTLNLPRNISLMLRMSSSIWHPDWTGFKVESFPHPSRIASCLQRARHGGFSFPPCPYFLKLARGGLAPLGAGKVKMAKKFLLLSFTLWGPGRLWLPSPFGGFFRADHGNVIVCLPCLGEWLWLFQKPGYPFWGPLAGQSLGSPTCQLFCRQLPAMATTQPFLAWIDCGCAGWHQGGSHSPLPVHQAHWPAHL